MSHSVALIASGELNHKACLAKIRSFSYVIAVDGGLVYCKKMHIQPKLIIGDFDSTPEPLLLEYGDIEKIHFPKDKDKTDLELALEIAAERNLSPATVFGALGKRSDHTLYNLL